MWFSSQLKAVTSPSSPPRMAPSTGSALTAKERTPESMASVLGWKMAGKVKRSAPAPPEISPVRRAACSGVSHFSSSSGCCSSSHSPAWL